MIKTVAMVYRLLAVLTACNFDEFIEYCSENEKFDFGYDYVRLIKSDTISEEFSVTVDFVNRAIRSYSYEMLEETIEFSEDISSMIRAGLMDLKKEIEKEGACDLFNNFAKIVKS